MWSIRSFVIQLFILNRECIIKSDKFGIKSIEHQEETYYCCSNWLKVTQKDRISLKFLTLKFKQKQNEIKLKREGKSISNTLINIFLAAFVHIILSLWVDLKRISKTKKFEEEKRQVSQNVKLSSSTHRYRYTLNMDAAECITKNWRKSEKNVSMCGRCVSYS